MAGTDESVDFVEDGASLQTVVAYVSELNVVQTSVCETVTSFGYLPLASVKHVHVM